MQQGASVEKKEINQSFGQFLSFRIGGQLFGVPVLQVNDVLGPQKVTHTPLAPPAVSGLANLRGRIVTAIDVRKCLNQPARNDDEPGMSVVVDQNGELFGLTIDTVGDVLNLSDDTYESTPASLDPNWRSIASGIHKLQNEILIVLDIKQLLELISPKTGTKDYE